MKLRLPNLRKSHLNAFPAVHLKKMDHLDVFLKFSSELLVIGLALLVGFLNIVFFKFGTGKPMNDNSHAFKLLSYHTALNSKYYAKETSISTVLMSGQGFITQAKADDFEGLTGQTTSNPDSSNNLDTITEEGLVKPNPDSIKELVAKQVKIYETQPGDTIQSIAATNGISPQTVLDANNLLNGTIIKPGWYLKILPVDGELYTANNNDTLPDVAKKFSGNLDTIISYNGLSDAEDITGGQIIIIPGGHLPQPVIPKTKTPAPKKTPVDKSKIGGNATVEEVPSQAVGSDYDEVAHIFPKGYCTWYVAQKIHVPWGGNAKAWISNARAYGAVVDTDPARGTIVVTNESKRYGHVAYVESVNDDGTITVSEMNYEHFGKVDYRRISLSSSVIRGFIHP